MRDCSLYFDDIKKAIVKIEKYSKGLSLQKFKKNSLVIDAIIRNLEVIGEASKHIPEKVKKSHPNVEWKKITAFRNVLIHEYFGVDSEILWDVVVNKIPALKKEILSVTRKKK